MEKTEMTIAIKKAGRNECYTKGAHVGTNIPEEEHELLKLLVRLRGTNVSQFLKEHIFNELDKNRSNLELIKAAIDDINSNGTNIVAINKIA